MSSKIDKEWMKDYDRKSSRYLEGVNKFVEFVVKNADGSTLFSCPCKHCENGKGLKPLDDISYHLLSKGIDPSYTIWHFHGEKLVAGNENKKPPKDIIVDDDEADQPRMEQLLNDAYEIHPLADPTVEESGDNVDNIGVHYKVDIDSDIPGAKKYKSLHASGREPLYPSCPKGQTTLYAVVKLNNLKTQYGFSDNGVTALLDFLKELLPEGNTLPTKYPDMKKMIKELGMDYIIYDACINDCILYWKDHANKVICPVCNEPRYKTIFNDERRTTKVPQKTLRHFPLITRLKRLYSIPWIANAMTWHSRAKSNINVMRHPVDSSAWRTANDFSPEFAVEPRNVTLGISTDGFNPHGSLSNNYSCWPVIVVPYNLPPSMCMKREFSMLTLLISGPKAPGKDIDVYLEPLVDELKQLWHEGVTTHDSFSKSEFVMKARLLWAVHDFPALGTLSGCITHGYFACPSCGEGTCSEYLPFSKKICYMGHRRFLPSKHKYRDDKTNFNKEVERGTAPWPLTGLQVEQQVANINIKHGKGKLESVRCRKRKNNVKDDGHDDANIEGVPPVNMLWSRRSILYDLPYWSANSIRHNLDVMHVEKNVTEHLINTIMGTKDKSKDGINARKDLKALGFKKKLWLFEDPETGKKSTPKATFSLSKEEKKIFCTVLKNLKVPSKFSSNLRNNVNINPPELRNFKSHDYHVVMQNLLPLLLQNCYSQHKDLRNAIHRISIFFNILCSKVINREHLIKAKASLVEAICVLEKHFPPSFFVISIHLMVHLADEALICGPVRYRWMYPFERLMKTYKGYVRNKRYIEGCIAEGYILQEASLYCMEYMPNAGDGTHKHTREAFLDENDEFADEIPLDNGRDVTLTQVQFEQVRQWVLNKYDGLDHWRRKYDSYVKSFNFHGKHRGSSEKTVKSFLIWLRDELVKTNDVDSILWRLVHGPMFKARSYTKYQVNGFVFSPREYEARLVTQDSGVSMKAITKNRAKSTDKKYKEADTTYYGVVKQIIELDYIDFKQTVFYCDWVKVEDKTNGCKVDPISNLIMVNLTKLKSIDKVEDEPFILSSEATQVFYSKDPSNPGWSAVLHTPKRLTTRVDDIEFPVIYQSALNDNEKFESLLKCIC